MSSKTQTTCDKSLKTAYKSRKKMSSQSNMLCERRKGVSFGFTHIKSCDDFSSLTVTRTKEDDGPNASTMVFGQVVSGHILGHFNDSETFRSIYTDKLIAMDGEEWIAKIQEMIDDLSACEGATASLYYQNYRLTKPHIPKLNSAIKIIKLANLEVRYEKLLRAMNKKLVMQPVICTTKPLSSM